MKLECFFNHSFDVLMLSATLLNLIFVNEARTLQKIWISGIGKKSFYAENQQHGCALIVNFLPGLIACINSKSHRKDLSKCGLLVQPPPRHVRPQGDGSFTCLCQDGRPTSRYVGECSFHRMNSFHKIKNK